MGVGGKRHTLVFVLGNSRNGLDSPSQVSRSQKRKSQRKEKSNQEKDQGK